MQHYSAIEKNLNLVTAITWMNLTRIMLSEIRKRKTNTAMISFKFGVQKTKTKETKLRLIDRTSWWLTEG